MISCEGRPSTLLMLHSGLEDALLPPSGDASSCPGLWTCHAGCSRISFELSVGWGIYFYEKVMLGDQEWIVLSGLDEVRRPYLTFSFSKVEKSKFNRSGSLQAKRSQLLTFPRKPSTIFTRELTNCCPLI